MEMIFLFFFFLLIAITAGLKFWPHPRPTESEAERRCRAYERSLGLPFWSAEETDRAIWARAAAGDEQAWEILSAFHGQEPPLRLDRSGQEQ